MIETDEVVVAVMDRVAEAIKVGRGVSGVMSAAADELRSEALIADVRGAGYGVEEMSELARLVEAWASEYRAFEGWERAGAGWDASHAVAVEAVDAASELADVCRVLRGRLASVESERNNLKMALLTLERSVDASDATVGSLVALVGRLATSSSRTVRILRDEQGRPVGAEVEERQA